MINAPPRISRKLLRPLSALRDVTALLDRYRYFDSRLLIHRDPAYAYRERTNWTAYNAGVDGRECEGSAWVGALHDPLPSGATVDVFKSWAQRRRADPKRILLERRFKHPLITPRAIAAARALRPLQGRHGLYFSGALHDRHRPSGDGALLGHEGGRGGGADQPEARLAAGAVERAWARRHRTTSTPR